MNENLPRETVEDIIVIAQAMRKLDFFVRNDSIAAADNIIDARGTRFSYTPIQVGPVVFQQVSDDECLFPRDFFYSDSDDCA